MKGLFFNEWKSSYVPEILEFVYDNDRLQSFFLGKSDLTIVDVGAGIGVLTNYLSQFGKVYAFEPCKKTFKCLTKMVKFNNLDVVAEQVAISDENGEGKLYHSDNSTANSLLEVVSNGTSENVRYKTLGEALGTLKHVDFLWLDTAGKEFDILGSDNFDEVSKKIDVIMGEISNWNGRNPGQIKQSLENRGYKVKMEEGIFYGEK